MKNDYFIFLILVFITANTIFGQSLSGVLVNEETYETIPYVAVQLGSNFGVITNQEGEFQINADGFSKEDSLIFSSMGYVRKAIALKDFSKNTIFLAEDINQLENVYLVNKNLSIEEIMTKVNENLAKNYDYSHTQFDIFIRNKDVSILKKADFEIKKATFLEKSVRKKFNKSIDSLLRVTKNVPNTSYSESFSQVYIGKITDSIKLDIKKATQLKDESKTGDAEDFSSNVFKKIGQNLKSKHTFKLKSGLFTLQDSLEIGKSFKVKSKSQDSLYTKDLKEFYDRRIKKNKNLNPGKFDFVEDFEDYEFIQEKITSYNGEMVYVFTFKPDRRRAKYLGTLYISGETFAILKAEYQLAEGEKAQGINLKFLLGIKYYQDKDYGLVIFKKNEKNTYSPIYLKSKSHQYVYLNRTLKFKENTQDRSKRIKFKFDLLIENENTVDQEILFVKTKPISQEKFDAIQEEKGIPLEKIRKYNSSIWKDYNIIFPDKSLEEFKY